MRLDAAKREPFASGRLYSLNPMLPSVRDFTRSKIWLVIWVLGLVVSSGSMASALRITTPAVQLAATGALPPTYWMVGADGAVYSLGSAGSFGSLKGQPLNKPVVGMAATPTGNGYWLVASDGWKCQLEMAPL